MYYYRIYDDKEVLNFFKSALDCKRIDELKKEFEKDRRTFTNEEFVNFLRKKDKEAEIITITEVDY
ncbi:MAG: hypothetical protein WBD36_16025 [Bacteroidota bacterium]